MSIKNPEIGQIVYSVDQSFVKHRLYIGRIVDPLAADCHVLVTWEYPHHLSRWYHKIDDLYESPLDAIRAYLNEQREQLIKEGIEMGNGEEFLNKLKEKRHG